jgi:hydrogenase maturation protein HypF
VIPCEPSTSTIAAIGAELPPHWGWGNPVDTLTENLVTVGLCERHGFQVFAKPGRPAGRADVARSHRGACQPVTTSDTAPERLRVHIRGAVQGVGFRPFVYRLARELGLPGWVINSSSGVVIEVEGPPGPLEQFLLRVVRDCPPRAIVQGLESAYLEPAGFGVFEIRESAGGEKTALVLPDIATCPSCLQDLADPGNRRYRYPFTNCTNCGPRFSIIESLPYDRPNTTMAGFPMCEACRHEYEDPGDRRFHAQPNACPTCGPRLELWDVDGRPLAVGDEALRVAEARIAAGGIVAVKGLGGFHLVVDARDDEAVRRLRLVKAREEKPCAVMAPTLASVSRLCEVGEREQRLLTSPEAPIVLLRARPGLGGDGVARSVAPGNPYLGVMLPYTPLHHLLVGDLGFPIVATSGNRTDEPICTDEREAVDRLRGLADLFLVHNRPIARHVDDSLVRVAAGRELVLRRARGYAPLPVALSSAGPPILGVGAHLKNAVAFSVGANVFVSQHIGDLETAEAFGAFERVIDAFERMYEATPATVACDLHPDYLSTAYARRRGLPIWVVQHHLAHVLSCMAENELAPPVLGVSWDGTGFGPDGTIWGGEFLSVDRSAVARVASFRPFPLPGGDRAVREPRRAGLAVLHEVFGAGAWTMTDLPAVAAFDDQERQVLRTMIERGVNTPLTSSVGRLFDSVASIAGVRQQVRYEGQAAMELEFALDGVQVEDGYPVTVEETVPATSAPGGAVPALSAPPRFLVQWAPLIRAVVADLRAGCPVGVVSARFHNGLAGAAVEVARLAGIERVVLSGGCFQNRYLLERTIARLRTEGFRPAWHQRIPPNDGGISLGQVAAAAWNLA